jgi:ectoine hydroxylase-related dioxygenase (phytanoyl-CoA dioxygenase family)
METRLYSLSQPPSLAAFKKLCSESTHPESYPKASTIISNIPIYDLREDNSAAEDIDKLQDEWHHILHSGPGVLVLRNFVPDRRLLTQVNAVFDKIVSDESIASNGKGDHFASAGTNARIWNSFQKHAERHPASFVQYYSNPYLAAVCEAWLGPAYQITAQVNIVRPGGKPQVSHRDYHLGFQTAESCSRYPRATQTATQFLTLQGAVAHSDMPLASGPTRFLPFSQRFEAGFMAYRLPEFQAFFDQNWVSCELKMGDAVFFNPALFHAAGENCTEDVHRSANLLQISSPFGKTMETIDTLAIIEKCWDEVRGLYMEEKKEEEEEGGIGDKTSAILNAMGDGYPFPTNLDHRPPAPGGMAPESEVDVLRRGLTAGWATHEVVAAITAIRRESGAMAGMMK